MASPFSGMDPFIESQGFSTLHGSIIYLMQDTLQGRLPDGYYAALEERVWIDTTRWIQPDVKVTRSTKRKSPRSALAADAIATLTRPVIVSIPQDEHTEPYLDIYKKKGDKKRLLCSIEILSPHQQDAWRKGV